MAIADSAESVGSACHGTPSIGAGTSCIQRQRALPVCKSQSEVRPECSPSASHVPSIVKDDTKKGLVDGVAPNTDGNVRQKHSPSARMAATRVRCSQRVRHGLRMVLSTGSCTSAHRAVCSPNMLTYAARQIAGADAVYLQCLHTQAHRARLASTRCVKTASSPPSSSIGGLHGNLPQLYL